MHGVNVADAVVNGQRAVVSDFTAFGPHIVGIALVVNDNACRAVDGRTGLTQESIGIKGGVININRAVVGNYAVGVIALQSYRIGGVDIDCSLIENNAAGCLHADRVGGRRDCPVIGFDADIDCAAVGGNAAGSRHADMIVAGQINQAAFKVDDGVCVC